MGRSKGQETVTGQLLGSATTLMQGCSLVRGKGALVIKQLGVKWSQLSYWNEQITKVSATPKPWGRCQICRKRTHGKSHWLNSHQFGGWGAGIYLLRLLIL